MEDGIPRIFVFIRILTLFVIFSPKRADKADCIADEFDLKGRNWLINP